MANLLCATLRAFLGRQVPFFGPVAGWVAKIEAVVGGTVR
jgi:hypothetical protein